MKPPTNDADQAHPHPITGQTECASTYQQTASIFWSEADVDWREESKAMERAKRELRRLYRPVWMWWPGDFSDG
jgi:hypothetical protein